MPDYMNPTYIDRTYEGYSKINDEDEIESLLNAFDDEFKQTIKSELVPICISNKFNPSFKLYDF